jgi:prevent-host-death family protein
LIPTIRRIRLFVASDVDSGADFGGATTMKKKESEVKPSQLYGRIGEYLGRVRWGGETFVVKKRGKPLARLIPAKDIPPGSDGVRRFPRPEYIRVAPGQFRSKMADCLAQVRIGGRTVLITYRGSVVAILKPVQ